MVNEELLKLAVKRIEADPSKWYQAAWINPSTWSGEMQVDLETCGTTACLAGHVVYAAGLSMDVAARVRDESGHLDGRHAANVAKCLLGLTDEQARVLFWSTGVKEVGELKELITAVTGVKLD